MVYSPRHSYLADKPEKTAEKTGPSAAEYLEKERGEEVARLIIETAQMAGGVLARPVVTPEWSADKCKKALKLAKELQPLWHQGTQGLVASMLDVVIARWTQEAKAKRRGRGRPLSNNGVFAYFMLLWAARNLGGRDEKQLSVTELIAAAAIAELPGVRWPSTRKPWDAWRKLRKDQGRRLLAEERTRYQRVLVDALRRPPKRASAEKVEVIPPKWAEFSPPERNRGAEEQLHPSGAPNTTGSVTRREVQNASHEEDPTTGSPDTRRQR